MTVFFAGDIVFLLSGGPLMTVRRQFGNLVEVDWFDHTGGKRAQYYVEQLMEFVENDEPLTKGHLSLVRDND